MDYNELIRSNYGFISAEAQVNIKEKKILLAGCGLGSAIAILSARTGFTRFIAADGDKVETGNLNRQAFRSNHIGRNKAEVTAELIQEINSDADVKIFPEFISTQDKVEEMVSAADIIINMVDPSPTLYQINQVARSQSKPVIFPMNIGFGAAVMIFTADSQSIEEMIPPTESNMTNEFFLRLVEKLQPQLPPYLMNHAELLMQIRSGEIKIPQLGIATNINAALINTAMIKLATGEALPVAPEPITLDSWNSLKTEKNVYN